MSAKGYPYQAGSGKHWELWNNECLLLRGTEGECWRYIHDNHSFSVDHALRFGGYRIVMPEGEVSTLG